MKGSFLGCFVRKLVALVQEIIVLPWRPGRPSTKYFFLTGHYFTSFVPITHPAGHWQVVPRRLSLNRCLCLIKCQLFPIY
jgi:hypothetical protein